MELRVESTETVAPMDPVQAVQALEPCRRGVAVCVVRCLGGVVVPGALLAAEGAGPRGVLRVEWIERYGRRVDVLDPPHGAKVRLLGAGAERLRPGVRLRGAGVGG